MEESNAYTFDIWWRILCELAQEKRHRLGPKALYREYYLDGDSPTFALEDDMRHSD